MTILAIALLNLLPASQLPGGAARRQDTQTFSLERSASRFSSSSSLVSWDSFQRKHFRLESAISPLDKQYNGGICENCTTDSKLREKSALTCQIFQTSANERPIDNHDFMVANIC